MVKDLDNIKLRHAICKWSLINKSIKSIQKKDRNELR